MNTDLSLRRMGWVLSATVIALACGSDDDGDFADDNGLRTQSLADGAANDDVVLNELPPDGPEELIIDGRLFVREWSLSEAELQQLKDPNLWQPPPTLDKVAQLVRAYVAHPEFGEYVEAEPNYELARISLGIDPSPFGERATITDNGAGDTTIEKVVSTDGDQRAVVASNTGSPANALAMYESGGTGVQVGSSRVYTAGHVLYNNANQTGADGWVCRDGSKSATGACTGIGLPRWRFGGKITNPGPMETWNFIGNWLSCGLPTIPSSWKNMPAGTSLSTDVSNDYGKDNLSACLPAGVGGLPWWQATQAELRSYPVNAFGYPFLTSCPAGAAGKFLTTDCASTGINQLRNNGAVAPISAGSVFVGVPVTDSALVAGTGYLHSTKVDTTVNMSGGPFVAFDLQWWVVGVDAAGNPAVFGETWFNKLTPGIVNFIYQ